MLWMSIQTMVTIYTSLVVIPVVIVEACWGSAATNIGAMTPDQKLLNGSQLLLECSLNNHTIEYDNGVYEVNSSMISFKFANRYVSQDRIHAISPTAAQLVVNEATIDDNGMYFCMLNISGLDHHPLVCVSHVIVGYKPQPVKDFKCISLHYRKLHCSWTPPRNPIATTYHLEDQVHPGPKHSLVRSCGISTETSCEWTTDTTPPYRNTVLKFNLLLTGQNEYGTHQQVFVIDHYSIIKPNIPKSLKPLQLTTNRIRLSWKAPEYIEYDEELLEFIVYEVEYYWYLPKSVANHNYKSRPVIIDGIRNTTLTLTDLIPHMVYNISIRCKTIQSRGSDYWGDFTWIALQTKPDVPYIGPELTRESFQTDKNMEGKRSITLFWKDVPIELRNGDDFHYSVVYSEQPYDRSYDHELDRGYKDVVMTQNTSFTFNHMNSNSAYIFKVNSENVMGKSNNWSQIVVDHNDKIAHKPLSIDAYSFGGGRYEIQWLEPRNDSIVTNGPIVNYTVFWCRTLRPRPFPCDGAIDWVRTTNKSIALELPDVNSNYQFAVATDTRTTTSGMAWAECIVPIDGRLDKISQLHLKVLNSTAIEVSWKLNCPAQKRVVEGYKILLCRLEILDICAKKGVDNIMVDGDVNSYIVANLLPFSRYKFTIVGYSDYGPGDESDPKYETTEHDSPEDAPSNLDVSNITKNSFALSWKPPLKPNGQIFYYEVFLNNISRKVDNHGCTADGCSHIFHALESYNRYHIQMRACNSDALCSPKTAIKKLTTQVSIPQPMDPPRSEAFNWTSVRISWSPPAVSNGPIDYYYLQLIRTDNSTTEYTIPGKQTEYYLTLDCETIVDESADYEQQYAVRIRSANVGQNDTELMAQYSGRTNLNACLFNKRNIGTIIGLVAGGTLGLMLLVMVLVVLVRWMKQHIRSINSLHIELPKGLEVPQLVTDQSERDNGDGFNPFGRTDSMPNMASGIVGNGDVDDDSFKNRHGSGLSHTSNSSTEGLIYRNTTNKANDAFLRMASSDSGQHESVSSHFSGGEAHMSSDSGVEIDNQLLTVDLMDLQIVNKISPKPPLPILDEIPSRMSDSSGSKDSGLDINAGVVRNKRRRKPKNLKATNISALIMPTKNEAQNPLYDHPMGHNVCIYSLLANSEPSLCEMPLKEDDNNLSDTTTKCTTKPEMTKSLMNIIQTSSPADSKVNCIICETNNTSSKTSHNCPYYKYGIKRQNHLTNNYLTNFSPEKSNNKTITKPNNGYITIDSLLESGVPSKPPKKRLEHDWSQNSYDAEVSSTSSNGDNDVTDVSHHKSCPPNCVTTSHLNYEKILNNTSVDETDNSTQINAICVDTSSLYPLRTLSQEIDDEDEEECETHLNDNTEEWTALSAAKQLPTGAANSEVFVRDNNGYVLHNAVNQLAANQTTKPNVIRKSNGYVVIEPNNGIEMNDFVPNNNVVNHMTQV